MHRARAPPPLRLSHPILCQKSSPRCRPWVLLVPVIFPVQLSHPRPPPAHAHSSHRRPVGPLGIRGPLLSPGPVGILCSGLRRQAAPWLRLHTVLWLPWWGWGAAAGGVGGRGSGDLGKAPTHSWSLPSVPLQHFCIASLPFPSLGSSRRSTPSAFIFWSKSTCCFSEVLVSPASFSSLPAKGPKLQKGAE